MDAATRVWGLPVRGQEETDRAGFPFGRKCRYLTVQNAQSFQSPAIPMPDRTTKLQDICGWTALAPGLAPYPSLGSDLSADCVVVGAGFTGLAAARRVAELRPGARVVLVEAKRVTGGASSRNSGFAVANESPGHAQLHTEHGRASYATMNRIDRAGVGELRRLIAKHGIAAEWEDTPSIHAAHDPRNFGRLHRHVDAFHQLGVNARLMEEPELKARLGTGFYGLGVETGGGALLQPAMLAQGLAAQLPDTIEVFEKTPISSIRHLNGDWVLEANGHSLRTPKVIVAVNAFFPRMGLKRLRVFPLALTASLTRPLSPDEESAIGGAASWGILSPRSLGATMRLTRDRRILIRNTAEYLPGGINGRQLARRRGIHGAGLSKRFAFLDERAIDYTWSGSICISRNAKPVFEETRPGLYLCGGYNASGVSRGTTMGRLIAEFALGQQSDLLSDALNLIKPTFIPPRPFLDMGVRLRVWAERRAAAGER